MPDVVLVSGAGPYADPWHDFPVTSARLARVVEGLGYSTSVTEDVESALADPGPCKLLAINIGNPAEPRPSGLLAAAQAGLETHMRAGGAVLAMHSSATSLTAMPRWPDILGGRWVRGVSMHPPMAPATITVSPVAHAVTAGLSDFEVVDERYSFLETRPGTTVLCQHDYEGRWHPVVWARETDRSRVVYDGLGHEAASYDSQGHLELLRRIVRWLLCEPAPRSGALRAAGDTSH
jgi:uncharacterized protein